MRICNSGAVSAAMFEVPVSNDPARPWEEPSADGAPSAAMRILIVLHDFSGGGTERVAVRLANEWARAGRVVHIFCGDERGPARALVDPRVTVERAVPALPRSAFSRIRLGLALAQAAARFRPDAIFAPGNFHMLALAAFSWRDRSGVTTFCKISNPLIRADRKGVRAWFRRRMLRALTGRIDLLIAMSPALRAEAVRLVDDARVEACWEPILAPGPAALAPSASDLAREPDLIVAVGRLEPQKNFSLAIEAMSHLARWSDARLVILGEGRERARLTALIDRLGLHQRVFLPGHVGDIRPWLGRASCVLMTSHYEGYPAALIEALACGAPVIVTRCSPALRDIVPHASATIEVESDPGAIVCALQAILRQQTSARADPILLARHDHARAAASYLALLDKHVARGSAQRVAAR